MTKLRNKIVLVLLALCLAVCTGLFVACGGGDDNKNKPDAGATYTVTVNKDGAPVKGVKVTVKKDTLAYAPAITGDDGKATFKLVKSNDYIVELSDLPENYEAPEGTLTFPADRNLTVNLVEKFAYKVKLVDKDGAPFTMKGVTVGICTLSGTCLEGVELDANGVARIDAAKTDYHIQILGLPAGYAYECDSHGYSVHQSDVGTYIYEGDDNTYNSLSETVTEQTIKIYTVNVIDFAKLTPLTDAELNDRYNSQSTTITGYKAYRVPATVPAEGTEYYSFTAEYSGKYKLYAIGYSDTTMAYTINPRFLLGNTVASGSGIFNPNGQEIETVKGEQYYINITSKAAQLELEFILTTPLATKDTVIGADTVKAVINKEGANAVIALAPTSGASYKLTVQGNGAIAQELYAESAENHEFADTELNSDYSVNANCTAKFAEDQNGYITPLYFAVSVKANSYPATVNVKIEKTNALTTTVENVQPTVTLAQFGTQTGKELVPIEMDGTSSAKIIYNDTDKYYHYGTVDGPLVVVMLTETLPADRFAAGAPLLYLELATQMRVNPYVFDVTTAADKASLTKGNTYKDYREMLRGFKNYKATPTPGVGGNEYTIPAEKTASYYAKYVNSDGVYPLTNDLKDFLQYVVADDMVSDNYVQWQIPMDADYDDLWLFACYYYDTYIEPDVIVGEYNHVAIKAIDGDEFLTEENGDLTGDEYTLVVNKRGTYAIKEYSRFTGSYEVCEKGTWTKSDAGVYTFTRTVEDGEDVVYNVTFNQEEGYVTLMTAASKGWAFRNENSEVVDVIVGEYKFVRLTDADGIEREVGQSYRNMFTGQMVTVTEDDYKLTVNADGTFMIYELSDEDYVEAYSELGEWEYKKGVYTFTVPNATLDDGFNFIDLVFTVDYNIGTGELALTGSDTSEWEFKKDGEAFVGLYELVSFTVVDINENTTTEYEVGDTYRDWYDEYEVTKDFYSFNVIGKTCYLAGYEIPSYDFEGTWAKTIGGKYILSGKDAYGYPVSYDMRYNKATDTYSFTLGDENSGYVTFVFQKKANQTIDAIVGEYTNLVKMVVNDEELTAESGDIRSDDYKLRVKAGGFFDIRKFGYPEYEVDNFYDGMSGKWSKDNDGYKFVFLVYGNEGLEDAYYTVTLSNDLSEISLVYTVEEVVGEETEEPEEVTTIGWWFTKSAADAGEADVIVGEYKFVMKTSSDGYVTTIGDWGYDMSIGESVRVTEDYYSLVVFKNGRFAIAELDRGERDGLWSKEDDGYQFGKPANMSMGVSAESYTVEFDAATGRIVLTKEKGEYDDPDGQNEVWVFQKGGNAALTSVVVIEDAVLQMYDNNTYGLYVGNLQLVNGFLGNGYVSVEGQASSVTDASAEYEMGVYTWTVDDNEYVYNMLGEFMGELPSTDGGAKLELYDNGGIKFYYHAEAEDEESEPTDTLACVAVAVDSESETLELEYIWLEEDVLDVVVTQSMGESEDGTDYVEITVEISYFDGEPATYTFVMPMGGGEDAPDED